MMVSDRAVSGDVSCRSSSTTAPTEVTVVPVDFSRRACLIGATCGPVRAVVLVLDAKYDPRELEEITDIRSCFLSFARLCFAGKSLYGRAAADACIVDNRV